ncbi:MAG: Uncharacterised protein [Acidimicrobiales bacterium AG-410-I20]|nr:MAG: Uncharacterised protein [Acidimicrobiales bacterium AG-410-I20]
MSEKNEVRSIFTAQSPSEGDLSFGGGHGVTVEIDIDASPAEVWTLVSDINLPARFSDEFQGAEWIDAEPGIGAKFAGRNKNENMGEWEVVCTIVDYAPEEVFAWHASDVENPAAQWRFEIESGEDSTLLRFIMVLGPGPSGLTAVIEKMPDMESRLIRGRQKGQKENMSRTVEGIRDLAEATNN